ncbi:MAG: glycerol kinase GlpK [Acidimicrobiaceae bacterium]|nr:glycerol kinase GlpK [Acidimicrobiaceae bacterium]
MELVLALDAGTTGVRTVAFDERAHVVDSAYRELSQHFPKPGDVEHDAAEIADLSVATLREVGQRLRSAGHVICALGIANQRETTIAFDRETGHLPHRALVWQDRRSAPYCEAMQRDGHGPQVRLLTGLVLDSYFSATKMRWFLDHGHMDALSSPSFATVDTWLLWWLSGGVDGGVFNTEPSNASRTMLMDLETLDWSHAMTSRWGVDPSMLADIRPSTTNFASISAEVVPELAGVPVTGILGDQQAALFGQACFSSGVVKATYGTGAFILANVGERPPGVFDGLITTVAWDLGAFGPATYAVEGSAFVAGAAVQWLRDELGLISSADQLEPLARSVADSAGVVFVPAFSGLGSPFWRSGARGSLSGLSRGVGTAHVARALIEALAYQVRAMTDAFRHNGLVLNELRADGGAAAMDLLMQLQATNSRLSVLRSSSLEATARGAATIAGLELGLWNSLEELSTLFEHDRRFEPEDPVLADLGFATWMRAAERA